MRAAIDSNKFIPIDRDKNIATLLQLNITWKDALDYIYDLDEKDYYSGPSVDRDRPFEDYVWVFKKEIDGNTIYIKFKVLYQEDGEVKIISFHIDDSG